VNQVSKHSIFGKILLGIPSPQKNRLEITTALLSLRVGPRTSGIPHKASPYEEAGEAKPRERKSHSGPLPQHFGDEFGWEEMAQAVSSNSMPLKSGPKRAFWLATTARQGNRLFRPALRTAQRISAHQNYYFWGPHIRMREFASKSLQIDTSGRLNLTPLLTGDCRLVHTIPQRGE